MNNKFNELEELKNLITYYYNFSWLSKKLYFFFNTNKVHKHLSKYFYTTADIHNLKELKELLNWIDSSNYFIVENINKEICFRLINKDYSLLTQIDISKNSFIKELPLNSFILELHYLISLKKGKHIGSKFLIDLINLQKILNIPLILYCSYPLINYYKKFGFKVISKNTFNEYLLVYGL